MPIFILMKEREKKECGFGLVGKWGECLRSWRRRNGKPQSEYIILKIFFSDFFKKESKARLRV